MELFDPTPEQQAIISADLVPLAVIACPGSGKTATAVRRLVEVRKRLPSPLGRVALLSYSNVAVDTFREEYRLLTAQNGRDERVAFHTVDSFIATYILRPHGARIMGCDRTPYLVQGGEPFLANFGVGEGKGRFGLQQVVLDRKPDGSIAYYRRLKAGGRQELDEAATVTARQQAISLGKVGGYTYTFGRGWALGLLRKEKRLAAAMARRFPQILVDEAQDIGFFEGEILDVLAEAGSVISLIGDIHQSIYGFNFATGAYLREFDERQNVLSLPLTQNRRSLSPIVNFGNALAGTSSKPYREICHRLSGTFYWRYNGKQLSQFILDWSTALKAEGYDLKDAAVLCRGNTLLSQISPSVVERGESATKHFAAAAMAREQQGDIALALDHCANGVSLLLEGLPNTFSQALRELNDDVEMTTLRRLVWRLIRNPGTGIPMGSLAARSEWLPVLKKNLGVWLDSVESQTNYRRVETWVHRVKTNKLPEGPLVAIGVEKKKWDGLRFGTIHSVKGEGISAVMYLTRKKDLAALLAGTSGEDGRIGFVAATRAKDLLVVGVPDTTDDDVIETMQTMGLIEWDQPVPSIQTASSVDAVASLVMGCQSSDAIKA